jgi:precorrin-6B methylase 2
VVINFGEEMYRAFGELLQTVRTGETAFELVYGKPLFDYYTENPQAEASGSARMLARTLPVARELAHVDVVRDAHTLVDVGGGTGTVLVELLDRDPTLRAVLLERPGVLELARAYLAEQGVDARCELVEGDFFASVPTGGDLDMLKSVLHDWDDQHCVTILRNCRQAMSNRARLAIVEFVLPERMAAAPESLPAALLDLIMLAYAGGRERTHAEFARLLDQANLRLDTVTALAAGPHVLQAIPA